MGNVALYNYVNKLHIEILYLWVNIVILLDSNNEIKKIGFTAPLIKAFELKRYIVGFRSLYIDILHQQLENSEALNYIFDTPSNIEK